MFHILGVALLTRMARAGRDRLTSIEKLHEELYEFG
jgi:two-component sensor histidine kinase